MTDIDPSVPAGAAPETERLRQAAKDAWKAWDGLGSGKFYMAMHELFRAALGSEPPGGDA